MKGNLKQILGPDEIQQKVIELGKRITHDFEGRELTVIGVLKGAFVFMADLVRNIQVPLRCDFLRVASYDHQGHSTSIRLEFDLTQPIEGQQVLLVEGILDTGKTLRFLLHHLSLKKPKSLEVCCLFNKGLAPDLEPQVRYIGFKVPPKYLVGYGLDLAGRYRELPYVAQIENSS